VLPLIAERISHALGAARKVVVLVAGDAGARSVSVRQAHAGMSSRVLGAARRD